MTHGPPLAGLLLGSDRLAPVALGIIIISQCLISPEGVLVFQSNALAGPRIANPTAGLVGGLMRRDSISLWRAALNSASSPGLPFLLSSCCS